MPADVTDGEPSVQGAHLHSLLGGDLPTGAACAEALTKRGLTYDLLGFLVATVCAGCYTAEQIRHWLAREHGHNPRAAELLAWVYLSKDLPGPRLAEVCAASTLSVAAQRALCRQLSTAYRQAGMYDVAYKLTHLSLPDDPGPQA